MTIASEADSTTQEIHYDAARVLAVKDRQDRWQSFVYENGHLSEIWDAPTPKSGNQLDKIEYDGAGRVIHWTTPDAKIDYANFTLDGLPQSTTQTRFKNHSGLSSADVLDSFSQTHGYNGHGERTSYSVPGGGAAGWATSVNVHYDAMGNIDTLTTDGGLSLTGDYRAAGRPNSRTIAIGTKSLERKYKYKDGTGQLEEMRAAIIAGGVKTDVAGSSVAYDGLLVNDAALIGVSAGLRHSSHTYDKRGRLNGSIAGASTAGQAPPPGAAATAPGSTAEAPDPADFRTAQSRAPLLDPAVSALLQSRGVDTSKIDPPSQTATPAPGHKIATFSRGAATRSFDFAGKSELLDDGLFRYHYDQKGRLDWAADKATATGVLIRRILYTYDGNNRLVGRTAQAASVTSLTASYDTFTWNLETRQPVIAADGIPAETTFVWDPVSDRIIAVFRTGERKVANDPNNNALKQIIHGDLAYDDPLEVTTLDTSVVVGPGQAQPVTKLYPIYDEAAGGTLQVVLNKNGEIVARSINNDPFGGAEFDLAGAAIDHVEVQAAKNAQGGLASVAVTMRATEALAASSIAAGTRLSVVDANGTVVRTSTAQPTLADAFTVKWTLPAAEWNALADPTAVGGRTPVSLSIAATNTLRAALWKLDLPILPAPDWAAASKSVFTSSTLPVEVRESLANITSTINALNAGDSKTTISYDVPNLGLVGTPGNADVENLLAATFQAQPFAEPFTRKFYVRERWYDPTTGAWMTPDPMGYADSANLYAYAGGDPVNCSDPTGEAGLKDTALSVAGWGVGVVESAGQAVFNLNPLVFGTKATIAQYQRGKRIVGAYKRGGVRAAAEQYGIEQKAYTIGLVKSLPIVHSVLSAMEIPSAYEQGPFEGGRQVGRTTFSVGVDASLIYGGVRGVQAIRRAGQREVVGYNARTRADVTQSVLDFVDTTRLPANTRFGPAVYLAEEGETAVLEVEAHGGTASHVIRYNLRVGRAQVLDLTQSQVASRWGYVPTTSATDYAASQGLAQQAAKAGYNVIRYPSVRGSGVNYAVLDDFDELLVPQNVSPARR